MNLLGNGVHKQHRIHTKRLSSGVWIVSLVKLGTATGSGRVHAGPPVESLRGEHSSEDEAVAAAKRYIDQVETSAAPAPEDRSALGAGAADQPERDVFGVRRERPVA